MKKIALETTCGLIGGGGMGDLIRSKDWSTTALGNFKEWPSVLCTTLNILLNSKSPMFLFWGTDLICFYNDAYRPSLGNSGKHPSALGKPGSEVWLEIWPQLEPQIDKVMQQGEATWNEDLLLSIYRNGQMEDAYWTFSYSPVFDEGGKPAGVFVSVMETTEKIRTLKKIEESENNLRNVILQAPVAMCILKEPTFIVEIANDRMFELWGKSASEVLHKPIFEGLPEAKNQGFEELLNKVYTTGETVKAFGVPAILPRDSKLKTIYINFIYEAFRESDGSISGVMAVASEVTEQVMATKKIEKSEASFRLLADSMPQFVWTADAEGNLDYFNQAVYDYSGLSIEQVAKEGWLQIVHPDEREENVRSWIHAVQTGEDFLFHHRFKNKNGEYRWQLSRAVPLKGAEGTIQMWVGTSTDIHDQKLFEEKLQAHVQERTTELERTNAALLKSNHELSRSNANLEEFAHAASHDLKEPIRKVRYFGDVLKRKLEDRLTKEEAHFFERMEKAGERMGLLVDDLLAYSHVSTNPVAMETIDLNDKVQRVLEDLELLITQKEASIIVGKLPTIKGHRRQLQQLFQNLIANALKYSKAGIAPHITITAEQVDGEECKVFASPTHKLFHKINVKDNGIGFEQQYEERIFQMFQRLHGKDEYSGTGVGLSIARKVAQNHSGYITAESEPEKGTTFKVYLPV